MELILPTRTDWAIERSHLVSSNGQTIPESINIHGGVMALENVVQLYADGKDTRDNRLAIGLISYRYEIAEGKAVMVHCYFINKHDKLTRFMRLRRIG